MLERRDLLRGTAALATLASAQVLPACVFPVYEDLGWSRRLVRFLKDGDEAALDGLFEDYSTLVAFNSDMIEGTDQISFSGAEAVRSALAGFRKRMTAEGYAGTRPFLFSAVLLGDEQLRGTNKIELLFSEARATMTSCGPMNTRNGADLYYQAGVQEPGAVPTKWSIERIALVPAPIPGSADLTGNSTPLGNNRTTW
jgi:hypothetical protein